MAFEQNVFINCPFDKEYRPMLRAVFFCLIALDYRPQVSETNSSAENRLSGIIGLIGKSKYSIHDLSRMKASKKGELSRSNMPFELGLDVGCLNYGTKKHRKKCMLIFDKEQYRYQISLSDIAGSDIESHGGRPIAMIRKIRNWITGLEQRQVKSGNALWDFYNVFLGHFAIVMESEKISKEDLDEMRWSEFRYIVERWVKMKRAESIPNSE